MVGRAIFALCAIALAAGCKQQADTNQAADANPPAQTRNAADSLTPDQALAVTKQRERNMETLGEATKKVTTVLKTSPPDLGAIRQSAATIAALAPKLQSWFPQGTAEGVGKSRAKADIWRKAEDFTVKANDFEQSAQDFDSAAKSGDMSQVEATFATLGKSCKACHDAYRAPKKD